MHNVKSILGAAQHTFHQAGKLVLGSTEAA